MSGGPDGAAGRARRALRVLVTADPVGGVWDHVATLSRRLARRGHDVLVASLGRPSPERRAALDGDVALTVAEHRLEWMEGGLDEVEAAARWIREEAEDHRADVVHLNQMTYAPWIGLPTVAVVHSDVMSWHRAVHGAPAAGARWAAYGRAVARGLAAADAIAAPSRYQADLARAHFGRAADRVIWNGVERAASRGRAIPAAGLPPMRPRGLCVAVVGRAWDPAKGVDVLDRALAALPAGTASAFLAGDTVGPHGEQACLQRVRGLGRLSAAQVRRLLASADVYAGPSLYEPFGLAPVEAALEGCALVLSDIGSFRELWGDVAVLVPPGDDAALAEALAALAADEPRRRALALAAREHALARFDARRMAGDYERLYRQVADARPTSREETLCV